MKKKAQFELYNTLQKSVQRLNQEPFKNDQDFVRDELDQKAIDDLDNLGRLSSQKYIIKKKLTFADEQKLQHLLYENGYQPLNGKPPSS